MFESKVKIDRWVSCGDDFYYGREGETVDYELAYDFYEKASKKKHPHATFMLGLCNEMGRGTDKDLEYADILYELADNYGDTDAKKRRSSGKVYESTAPRGDDEAEITDDNEENAAEDDNTFEGDDPFVVGMAYEDLKQYAEAAKWYRKAAEAGDNDAILTLSVLLLEGEKIPFDDEEAEKWLRVAANNGDHDAMSLLATMLADEEERLDWMKRVAEAGDTEAMVEFAGLLVEQGDNKQAEGFLRKAAELGHADAMLLLSDLLYKRSNTETDRWEALYDEATGWLKKAASAGSKDAKKQLKDAEKMEKLERLEAARIKWDAIRAEEREAKNRAYWEKRKAEKEADRQKMRSGGGFASSNHYAGAAAATRAAEKAQAARNVQNRAHHEKNY